MLCDTWLPYDTFSTNSFARKRSPLFVILLFLEMAFLMGSLSKFLGAKAQQLLPVDTLGISCLHLFFLLLFIYARMKRSGMLVVPLRGRNLGAEVNFRGKIKPYYIDLFFLGGGGGVWGGGGGEGGIQGVGPRRGGGILSLPFWSLRNCPVVQVGECRAEKDITAAAVGNWGFSMIWFTGPAAVLDCSN